MKNVTVLPKAVAAYSFCFPFYSFFPFPPFSSLKKCVIINTLFYAQASGTFSAGPSYRGFPE